MNKLPAIVVTGTDLERLESLLSSRRRTCEVSALAAELERAKVVDARDIARDVVTMHSVVRFEDDESGDVREITLVYPHEADVAQNRISVLAPVGAALLGLAVGQTISWKVPSGRPRRLRVVEVLSQPSTGDAVPPRPLS